MKLRENIGSSIALALAVLAILGGLSQIVTKHSGNTLVGGRHHAHWGLGLSIGKSSKIGIAIGYCFEKVTGISLDIGDSHFGLRTERRPEEYCSGPDPFLRRPNMGNCRIRIRKHQEMEEIRAASRPIIVTIAL